ncbi:MAG: hypothetical protein M1818_003567 [Claussenomyces sp. TS43310]|nr:MAG: hypothetical protein M1818_003567 [Claussenomyces sp. TS43310]
MSLEMAATNVSASFNTNMLTPFKTRLQCKLSTCSIDLSLYDYRPSIAINLLFIVLFSITGFIHLTQLLFWPKTFFSCAIAIGCVVEIAGYIARIVSNPNPFGLAQYFIQFIGLTIAPAFFSASIYTCLGEITNSLGPQFSRLRPEIYAKVFVLSDLASLLIQGSGGLAALGLLLGGKSGQAGINVMLIGLGYQIISLMAFIYLAAEFAWRLSQWNKERGETVFGPGKSETRLQIFLVFFCLSVFCLFARCCYRCAELSGGLEGPLLHDEVMFIFLEGMLISICVFSLNLGHPGMLPAPTIISLDQKEGDPEKALPEVYLTPASEKDDRHSKGDRVYEDPSVQQKRGSGLLDLLSPKRLSHLAPNPLSSHPNKNLRADTDALNERRLSAANSLTDIYTMYHGNGNGNSEWGNEYTHYGEKVHASQKYKGKDGEQVRIIYIRDNDNGNRLDHIQELPEYSSRY